MTRAELTNGITVPVHRRGCVHKLSGGRQRSGVASSHHHVRVERTTTTDMLATNFLDSLGAVVRLHLSRRSTELRR